MTRLSHLVFLLLLLASCDARPFLKESMPLSRSEGLLFVYLSPLPPEAHGLSFRIQGLFAEREDGGPIVIPLRLEEVRQKSAGRERLLGFCVLPAGRYTGVSLKVDAATLISTQGPSVLQVQEESAKIRLPFTVEGKRAVVLKLALRYQESVREGFGFVPDLVASVPGLGEVPTARRGIATSRGTNTITVFDKITGRVVSVIPTGMAPSGLAFDPSRNRVYVALAGEDVLKTIDLTSGREIGNMFLRAGDDPVELALTPNGEILLSANNGSNTVSLVDPLSMTESSRIPVGSGPRYLVLTKGGGKAYVINEQSNTVSIIDIKTAAVTGSIPTEASPEAGQLNRDESFLYVIHKGYPFLVAHNTRSPAEKRRIRILGEAKSLKVDLRTDQIYLSRRYSPNVDIYDSLSLLPIGFLDAGEEVETFSIDGEEGNLWVVLPRSGRLMAFGMTGGKIVAEVDVGDDPRRVAVSGER